MNYAEKTSCGEKMPMLVILKIKTDLLRNNFLLKCLV